MKLILIATFTILGLFFGAILGLTAATALGGQSCFHCDATYYFKGRLLTSLVGFGILVAIVYFIYQKQTTYARVLFWSAIFAFTVITLVLTQTIRFATINSRFVLRSVMLPKKKELKEYSTLTVSSYVMHLGKIPRSVLVALRHVVSCQICQNTFEQTLRERKESDSRHLRARGWWTGDDPTAPKELVDAVKALNYL